VFAHLIDKVSRPRSDESGDDLRRQRAVGLSFMSDARDEKLDVLLRSRLVEPIDPDFVSRTIAKSKALEQKRTPASDARKHWHHFKTGKSSMRSGPWRKSF
jgi:hypothetical protein